jgi:hypothetical protein
MDKLEAELATAQHLANMAAWAIDIITKPAERKVDE